MRAGTVGLALVLALAGCRANRPPAPPPSVRKAPVPWVAVLPFRTAQDPEGGPPIRAELGAAMARTLARHLSARGTRVIDPGAVLAKTPAGRPGEDLPRLAILIARQLGASRAVYGKVTRYAAIDSSSDAPASAAYEAVLVRTLDGKVLGVHRFDSGEGGGRGLSGGQVLDAALIETARRFAAAMNGPAPADGNPR